MAKITAYTILTPGHVFPFVPILFGLRERGHTVLFTVLTDAEQPSEVAGIETRAARWNAHLSDFASYGERLAHILEQFIAEERPDLILVDPALWGGMVAAEASGLPWVSLAHNPKLFRGRGVDIRGPGFRPPRGILGRLWHRFLEAGVRMMDARYVGTMNAVRAARGLPPVTQTWDIFHVPPLTIATTAEPFEYPRTDWHSSIRFVGPMLWEPPAPAPSWIEQLDERPVVLLVGSSIPEVGKARSWVSIALDALADEPYQVIATLPTDPIPERLPSNVRVERFIPHGHLLPRATCVVCHGGPGITQKALAAGVPVVAVPFAYDRFEVARRVQVAGAGVMLPGKHLTRARLRKAVRQAIRCKPGAERIAEAFRRAGGVPAAVDAIEELIANWREPGVCS